MLDESVTETFFSLQVFSSAFWIVVSLQKYNACQVVIGKNFLYTYYLKVTFHCWRYVIETEAAHVNFGVTRFFLEIQWGEFLWNLPRWYYCLGSMLAGTSDSHLFFSLLDASGIIFCINYFCYMTWLCSLLVLNFDLLLVHVHVLSIKNNYW